MATSARLGTAWPLVVGSPEQVADRLQDWIAETDVAGSNLAYIVSPESFSAFVDQVVPELQRRGVSKREYADGTLHEKLYAPVDAGSRPIIPAPSSVTSRSSRRRDRATASAGWMGRAGPDFESRWYRRCL